MELGKGFLCSGCGSEMKKQNWGGDLSQESGVTWEEREPGRGQNSVKYRCVSKQKGFAAHGRSSPAAVYLEMGGL